MPAPAAPSMAPAVPAPAPATTAAPAAAPAPAPARHEAPPAPAVGTASIVNNTLTVNGTNGPDAVTLAADATEVQVSFGANAFRFNLTDFNAISVALGDGNDQFTEPAGILADKHLTVDGGNGNDTIKTGDGADVIFGGNGNDNVDAGKGADTVSLGNGNDFFVWTPGEGSDAVNGNNGDDVMQFVGANVDETMSLSANGSSTVFLRSPGAVRMDLTDIETFNLQALGGVDNVTVGNLEGTSIRHTNLDLSGSAGGADQQADAVTVNGTDHDDHVDVRAAGGQVNVDGLPGNTRIVGSEPTLDHLQVNTQDGNDRVRVDPQTSTLIGVTVDLGLGQH
jgi:Ca2+-binding RTX toxin-like protein